MANCHRIIITLFVLVALSAQSACGETNSFTNNIDFSRFYREWQVSPENALAQIKPSLLELAASVKTNHTASAVLHNSLWHLFSTNSYSVNRIFLPRKKGELLSTVFIASTTCATSAEENVMGLAKALTFLENRYTPGFPFPIEFLDQEAYDAMGRKLIENGALEQPVPEIYLNSGITPQYPKLIKPRVSDPEEAWKLYEPFASIYDEINKARRSIAIKLETAAWGVGRLPQEDRNRIFAEIVLLQILRPEEERRFAETMNSDQAKIRTRSKPTK